MKRVLVVMLALVMGAGLLFAADQAPSKWSAYVEGWLIFADQAGRVGMGPSWASDSATNAADPAIGGEVGQFTDLTLSYAEPNMGFSFVDEFNSNDFGDPTKGLRNMSGWLSMFDGKAKLTAGLVRDASYRPASYIEGAAAFTRLGNAEWGMLLQLFPVKGLSLGTFGMFPQAMTAADYANMFGFGASYDIPSVATLYASYRMQDSFVNTTTTGTLTDEIGAAVRLNMIKGLPVLVAWNMDMYTIAKTLNSFIVSTTYTMGPMNFMLDAKLQYQTAFDVAVEAQAAYKLNSTFSLGANLGYATAGLVGYATDGGGVAQILLYPWVVVNVGSASFLELGFRGNYTGTTFNWNIPLKYVISF